MFNVDWLQKINPSCLTQFEMHGFFVLDDCFLADDFLLLQKQSGFMNYKDANLAFGVHQKQVRGDVICWMDDKNRVDAAYLCAMMRLADIFNRRYFLGIRRAEAHYACYKKGFGYHWHKDNPQGMNYRALSAVFYLNDDWQDSDGGHIMLVDRMEAVQTLAPKANRLVLFESDLLHKVCQTHRRRFSIASWLRRDDAV